MAPKVERVVSYEQDPLAIQHLRGNDPAADALKIVKAKYLTPNKNEGSSKNCREFNTISLS